jgi:hypothetical protein
LWVRVLLPLGLAALLASSGFDMLARHAADGLLQDTLYREGREIST